ncbi:MAG: hypothetical protein SV186_01705, partial [Candidatus Nanohaloarchaea archaeon]|nr:hypothetical protein [Candidatus Nanohaloarchaea archaeon]
MNPYLVSFLDAVRFALGTWRRRGIVTGLSVAAYVLMITSSFPLYSFQSLRYSIFSIGRVVAALTWNFHASYGAVGLGLLALYA